MGPRLVGYSEPERYAVPVAVREKEIQRIIRFYRKAIRDLAREFVAIADFEKPASFFKIQTAFRILEELDTKTVNWARKNVGKLYIASLKATEKELRAIGVSAPGIRRVKAFSVINRAAIEALLNDPAVGFVSSMKEATNQIKQRMQSIQAQAKLMVRSQRLFSQSIAQVGFLEGQNLNTVRDKLVREMVSMKANRDLLFTAKAAKLPPGQIIKDVANLPFVKIPDRRAADGFRKLRVDKYSEMLARTKTAQASNLARRNKALEHHVKLMQISKNKPLQNDACFLYIGKVFALTQSAKTRYGVPLLAELPNGGAPFHPNCTHQELQFVIEFESEAEKTRAFVPPPEWALNRPFSEVEKEYKRRGGAASIADFNRQQGLMTTGGRERRARERGALDE